MKIFTSLEFLDDLNFDRNQVSANFRIIYEIYVKYYKIEAWTMDKYKIYENDMKNVFLVNSVSYRKPTGTVSQHFFRDSCLELE